MSKEWGTTAGPTDHQAALPAAGLGLSCSVSSAWHFINNHGVRTRRDCVALSKKKTVMQGDPETAWMWDGSHRTCQ